jgi:hypothetical protein
MNFAYSKRLPADSRTEALEAWRDGVIAVQVAVTASELRASSVCSSASSPTYCSRGPEDEALFNPGTTELDGTKCAPIGNQIDRLIWHEARSVILYAWAGAVAVRANLANFGAFGFADADCLNEGSHYEPTIHAHPGTRPRCRACWLPAAGANTLPCRNAVTGRQSAGPGHPVRPHERAPPGRSRTWGHAPMAWARGRADPPFGAVGPRRRYVASRVVDPPISVGG